MKHRWAALTVIPLAWMGACIADFEGLCRLGASDCDGQCVDTSTDPGHCGACGHACPGDQQCVDGACQPPCGALAACDGACTDRQTDPRHCGSCGVVCAAGEICDQGACVAACAGDSQRCDGSCVDTASDERHCGGCGVGCAPEELCIDGHCGCHATVSDDANCGGCGLACGVGQRCFDGVCHPVCHGVRCEPGATVFAMRVGQAGDVVPTAQRDQLSYAVDFDRDGYAIFAADTRGAFSFGDTSFASSNDVLLARLDLSGRIDTAKTVGGGGSTNGRTVIALDDGGYLLAGSYYGSGTALCGLPAAVSGDGFVVRLAADRSCVWGVALASASFDEIRHIALAADGSIAVTGWTANVASFVDAGGTQAPLPHHGGDDIVVAMLDAGGSVRWASSWGGPLRDRAYAVAVDSAGNAIVTGEYRGALAFPTGELPASVNDQDAIFAIALAGADGSAEWGRGFAIDSTQAGHNAQGIALAVDAEDRSWLFGDFVGRLALGDGATVSSEVGSRDLVLLTLDADGALLSHQRWGDERTDEAGDLLVKDGVVSLSGAFEQRIDFGGGPLQAEGPRNVFVARLSIGEDLTLSHLLSRSFGGSGTSRPRRMAAHQGALLIVGEFLQEIDLGHGPWWSPIGDNMGTPTPENDAFIVAISL